MQYRDAVLNGLLQRGMPEHIAYGVAGNMAVESGFNPGINEINPVVPGSRGGYGLNQWTGPRRVQYEQFAQDRGAPLNDVDAQLDFMFWELENTEKRAADALYAADTVEDAARVYSDRFLRPGVPHLDRRISEAQSLSQGNALSAAPQPAPRQNALAGQPQQQERENKLKLAYSGIDPNAFMSKRRF